MPTWILSALSFLRTTGQVILAIPQIISMVKTIVDMYHAQKALKRKEALEEIQNAKTDEERHAALKKLNSNL